MSDWKPITQDLPPRDAKPVLVANRHTGHIWIASRRQGEHDLESLYGWRPTHWQPLPAAP